MADSFHSICWLYASIRNLGSGTFPSEFETYCLDCLKSRVSEPDLELYLLAYFLHPKYRGKGIKTGYLKKLLEKAGNIGKGMRFTQNQCIALIAQMQKYKRNHDDYNIVYNEQIEPALWWGSVEDRLGNQLQSIAIRLLKLVPS